MDEHLIELLTRTLRESLSGDYEITAASYADAAEAVLGVLAKRECLDCGVMMSNAERHQAWHNGA